MSYIFKTNIANRSNYGSARDLNTIKYLVIHYTSNDGDSDEGNGKYFHNNVVKASAHYFVDDDSVTQSVPDNYAAYSVGGKCQSNHHPLYNICKNANSISIEMCDSVKNGVVEITDKTIENTMVLASIIMKRYNITIDRVIRHYDVNGKACPNCNGLLQDAKWEAFKNRLMEIYAVVNPSEKPTENATDKLGTYVVTASSLRVRTGPGTGYRRKKKSELTANAREHATFTGALKKGTRVTVKEIRDGWARIPSGWVCADYLKKV